MFKLRLGGLCLLLLLCSTLFGCSDPVEPKEPKYATGLSPDETNISAFKTLFPQHYESYMKNNESDEKTMTLYKGSVNFSRNDNVHELPKGNPQATLPYVKNLWLGSSVMYEYNEPRGHTYALLDMLRTQRVNNYAADSGMPLSCWSCKLSNIQDIVAKNGGDKAWALPLSELRSADKVHMNDNSISCSYCHEPTTMELRIVNPALDEALKRTGKDWRTATRNEMRTLVCAQCHVNVYFQDGAHGPAKKPVFPWDLGKDPEDIYTYYNDKGPKKSDGSGFDSYTSGIHAASKVRFLKISHPEYEMWHNGPHGAAGVACADCHMPYQRMDGKKKMSKHQMTSPLRNDDSINRACRQCHADKSVDYLRGRVQETQTKVFQQARKANELTVRAHEAIRQASEWQGEKDPQFDALMAQAREWTRKSQFFGDYVGSENSMGFHNPLKAMDTLAKSQQYAQQAIDAAMQATRYGIAPTMQGDIYTLVPPIVEWTREMHMDPENLKKHLWTKYLKPLPKAELIWKDMERLDKK